MDNRVKDREAEYMEKFYDKISEYDALIIDADDLVEQDMNKGIIKICNSVFDDYVKDAVIYIYCADINADVIMEFVMKENCDDGIVMEWLDCFSV